MKSNSGLFPVSPVPDFILAEIPSKSSTLEQLPLFGLGLGSQSEKRGRISHFLVLPVSEKHFPGSSAILLSRDIPKFIAEELFRLNLVINFGLAINTKTRVNIPY